MFLQLLSAIHFTRQFYTDTTDVPLATYAGISIDDCESKCAGLVYCSGFVYQNSTNTCFVKSQMTVTYTSSLADSYFKQAQKTNEIHLNAQNAVVSGHFDTFVQTINISGSSLGSLNNNINITYISDSNQVILERGVEPETWNDTSIQLSYPSLNDLKYYYLYATALIRIQFTAPNTSYSFDVPVKYPDDFGFASPLAQNPFKCYFGIDAIKTEPLTEFIHLHNGEDALMKMHKNASFPNNFVALENSKTGLFLNGDSAATGHGFRDLNLFPPLITGYLFINTPNGHLIYNNGKYVGVDFIKSFGFYEQNIRSFDYGENNLVLWNCVGVVTPINKSPVTSPNSFLTNIDTFDVDLMKITIFGNLFGNFDNLLTTFINFELVKNGSVVKTDSRQADHWSNTNISIEYPLINDLRFFYVYKPEKVNIVVHSAIGIFVKKLVVRIPAINFTNSFQCFHPDGRSWKRVGTQYIQLDAGSVFEIQSGIFNKDMINGAGFVGLKENVTGNFLRHSNWFIRSNTFNVGTYLLTNDFRYLPIMTKYGYALTNVFIFQVGTYIGYEATSDRVKLIKLGDVNFIYWNCTLSYEYVEYPYIYENPLSSISTSSLAFATALPTLLAPTKNPVLDFIDVNWLPIVLIGAIVVLCVAVCILSRIFKHPKLNSKFGRKNSFGTLNSVKSKQNKITGVGLF